MSSDASVTQACQLLLLPGDWIQEPEVERMDARQEHNALSVRKKPITTRARPDLGHVTDDSVGSYGQKFHLSYERPAGIQNHLPSGDQTGFTNAPSTSRFGGPAIDRERETARDPRVAATNHDPVLSGDQSAMPWPATPSTSIDGATVCRFVPSAAMIERCLFPSLPDDDGERATIRRDGWRLGQCAVDVPPDFRCVPVLHSPESVAAAARREIEHRGPAEAGACACPNGDGQLMDFRVPIPGQHDRAAAPPEC